MKRYRPSPRPIHPILLGPCPCQKCGKHLGWDGMGWLLWGTDLIHNALTCGWEADR